MKYLGVDYGSKRIGLAVSDEDGMMAFPKIVMQNNSKIIGQFKNFVQENGIEKIIMGESKNYKQQDNLIMREILDFKNIIEKELELDVVLHSEVLSSAEAEQLQGKNDMIDASAAAIILQSYLDLLKNQNKN